MGQPRRDGPAGPIPGLWSISGSAGSPAGALIRQQRPAERRGEPSLVVFRSPASFGGEDPVNLGRHEHIDQVGGLGLSEPWGEGVAAGQLRSHPRLTGETLLPSDHQLLGSLEYIWNEMGNFLNVNGTAYQQIP